MQGTSKFIQAVCLLLVVAVLSCTKQLDIPSVEYGSSKLSIQTARSWFARHSQYNTLSGKGRAKASRFKNMVPLWEEAFEGTAPTGESYVEVPLQASKRVKWITGSGSNLKSIDAVRPSLVIYNQAGQTKENIKEVSPSQDYLSTHRSGVNKSDFTGKVVMWTWDGEFIGGSSYLNGKREATMKPISNGTKANARGIVCEVYTSCQWSSYCYNLGETGESGMSAVLFGTTTHAGPNSTCTPPWYGHGGEYHSCGPWDLVGEYLYHQCYDDGQTNPGEGGGPSQGSGAGIDNPEFIRAYEADLGDDPIKKRIFNLSGKVVINNRCQHQALRAYLLKAQDLEVDYLNKITQCGVQHNISGEALAALAGGLSFTSIAQFMGANVSATFRSAARGLLYGQMYNNLNLSACISGVQGDIAAEIEKAYNAYSDAYNQPCP
ncbi:hypothetical protein GGR92_003641 [Spirosoma lacussanchae]|uniref:hypothetical protein n=1 Tax=Spirosoma lacussanchae TaxID=1884249 RepID=UPI0011089E84|nr:hypothetical protein [Spirosoma lacussanchae]